MNRDKIIRCVLTFGVLGILVDICTIFFQSEPWNNIWNNIRDLTPEETFAKYPQYTILFLIVPSFVMGLMWALIHRIWDERLIV